MVREKFLNTLKQYDLIKPKDKIIIGLSGGPDSIALLYSFLGLKKTHKLKLACAHLNHGLRKEADREESFVKNLCCRLGVQFIAEKRNVANFAGDSLEQAARNLRFDFFLKISNQLKIKKIALAHHKDDLAETVLMRIIRGTGLSGLKAILPKSKFKNLILIRPFIDLRKQEILNWLKSEKIDFCLDKSNKDKKFLRNKIRIDLLPELEAINQTVVDRLSDLALTAGFDYSFIYDFSFKCFNRLKKQGPGKSFCFSLEDLRKQHPAVRNIIIRIAFEQIKGNLRRIEKSHLNQVENLIKEGRPGSSIHLPGILVKKEKNQISIQSLIL